MKFSINATIIAAAIFAAICLAFAVNGFTSLGNLTDPTEISDAKGFAWFWTFLATVAIVLGLVAWRISRRTGEEE